VSKEGKRRRCYLSKTEEAQFLASFLDEASAGQICVAGRLNKHWKIIWVMEFITRLFTGCLIGINAEGSAASSSSKAKENTQEDFKTISMVAEVVGEEIRLIPELL